MDDYLRRVAGFNYVEIDNYRYVGNCLNNSFCRINTLQNSTELLGYSEEDYFSKTECWAKTAQIGNKILFAPYTGNQISIYDIDKESISNICIHACCILKNGRKKFWEVVTYKNCFYLMGVSYPEIIRIDADTYQFSYLENWKEQLNGEMNFQEEEGKSYFIDGYIQTDSVFFFPFAKNSSLFKIDFEANICEVRQINCEIKQFLSISADGNEIWLTDLNPKTGRIVVWNRLTNQSRVITLPSFGIWYAPVFYENYAYLFPMNTEAKLYQIDKTSFQVTVYEELDQLFRAVGITEKKKTENRIASVQAIQQKNNTVTFIRRPDAVWFTYNFATGELSQAIYNIEDRPYLDRLYKDHYDRIYADTTKHNSIFYEEYMPLTEYINRIGK